MLSDRLLPGGERGEADHDGFSATTEPLETLSQALHRELGSLLPLAWPVALSTFARFLMVVVDVCTVGQLGTEELAAAAMANVVMGVFAAPPCSSAGTLNTLSSQALGAKNFRLAGIWLQLALAVTFVTNIPAIVGFWYTGELLALAGFSPRVCELASLFGRWSSIWLIPNGWYGRKKERKETSLPSS